MALQFRPPEDLVNAYMNRPSPGQEAQAGIQQALQLYAQQKAQQQQQQDSASGNVLKMLEIDPELRNTPYGQRMMKRSGADLAGYTPPVVSSGTAPSPAIPQGPMPVDAQGNPVMGPQQGPQLPGVGMGMAAQQVPASGMGAPSLIARWQQRNAQPAAQPPNQSPGMTMPDISALQGRGAIGEKVLKQTQAAMDMQKTPLEIQKLQKDLSGKGPLQTVTKEGALRAGTFDPEKQMIVEPPTRSEEADIRHQDRMARAVTDFGKQIETHPIIKTLMQQDVGLNQVEEMAHLVNSGNTVASSAMGTKMAKAMGEVGALTETDVKRYINSGKLTQGAADSLNKWMNGTPSRATMQEIGQISAVLRDSFGSKIQPIYDRHIERFARAYKMTPEEASYQLAIPYKKVQGGGTGGTVPEVGGMFEGGRVTKVTKISK